MRYVVVSVDQKDDETGEPLYWSNLQGWVGFSAASVFDSQDYNLPVGGSWEEHQPWSILYPQDGEIYHAGPFPSEAFAMSWANEHRYRGDEDQDEYEFDLQDTHVYLLGPDHSSTELNDSDFE